MSEEQLQLAIDAVDVANDVTVASNLGGDDYLFRDVMTGRFSFSGNVWELFREALDTNGGSQWLAEVGLI